MEQPVEKSIYYAVIATTTLRSMTSEMQQRFASLSDRMYALASEQDGFRRDAVRNEELGISVSYWRSLEAIEAWRNDARHMAIKALGRKDFYSTWQIRICRVESEYGNNVPVSDRVGATD